ncbi:MAG: hypothetical protein ACFFDN_37030 [Candidatus Hodarchaeota archaeon]
MGCKLTPILKTNTISFSDIKGKTVAVDGTNFLVRYISKIAHIDKNLKDHYREPISHLIGIFYFTINLMERKLRPIYVFDGMPLEEKRKVPAYHNMKLLYLWKKYHDSLHDGKYYSRGLNDYAFQFDKAIVECIEFLKLMGLPAVRAPSEGEAQASRIVREKHAFGVLSYDYDVLLFGSKNMIKDLDFESDSLTLIKLKDNLDNLGITYKQLVDMALLIGTDLNKGGVKGIGPKKALKLIRQYHDLETINEKIIPLEFDFRSLRSKFLDPPSFNFGPHFRYPNFQVLKSYLNGKFSKKRIEKGLTRLKKAFDFFKMQQQTIDKYFQ